MTIIGGMLNAQAEPFFVLSGYDPRSVESQFPARTAACEASHFEINSHLGECRIHRTFKLHLVPPRIARDRRRNET